MRLEWLARYCDQTCDSVNCTSETRSAATLAAVKQFSFTCLIVRITVPYQRSVTTDLFIEQFYVCDLSNVQVSFGKISYWNNHYDEFQIYRSLSNQPGHTYNALATASVWAVGSLCFYSSCYHLNPTTRFEGCFNTLYNIFRYHEIAVALLTEFVESGDIFYSQSTGNILFLSQVKPQIFQTFSEGFVFLYSLHMVLAHMTQLFQLTSPWK